MEEEKKDLFATLASTGGEGAYLAAMLERVSLTPNFKIDSVLGKFVILEFLVYLNQHECFERLWSLSFRGRCYLIKNYRFILNRLLLPRPERVLPRLHQGRPARLRLSAPERPEAHSKWSDKRACTFNRGIQ